VRRLPARGFTLLEVMVALAIVSIGLIAVFNAIIQMAHSTSVLRERALADWIAMNEISAIRVSGEFPEVGNFNETVEFAGRLWRWDARISETGVTDLRRIDMSVAEDMFPDDAITVMTGFVARGGDGPLLQVDWWGTAQAVGGAGAGETAEPGQQAQPGSPRPRRQRRQEEEEEE
jgi:general secretion pathway protein I